MAAIALSKGTDCLDCRKSAWAMVWQLSQTFHHAAVLMLSGVVKYAHARSVENLGRGQDL